MAGTHNENQDVTSLSPGAEEMIAFGLMTLPVALIALKEVLNSQVVTVSQVGPLVIKISQPLSDVLGAGFSGVLDGMKRICQGVRPDNTEVMGNATVTFANGMTTTVQFTQGEFVDLLIQGAIGVLKSSKLAKFFEAGSTILNVTFGKFSGAFAPKVLTDATLAVTKEAAAQYTVRAVDGALDIGRTAITNIADGGLAVIEIAAKDLAEQFLASQVRGRAQP